MLDLFDRSEGLSVDTAPALIWHEGGLWWCAPGQSARQLSPQALSQALTKDAPLVCHMPALARRGGLQRFRALDVLELFAFVRPARTVTPTPRSLTAALDIEALPEGASPEEQAGNCVHSPARCWLKHRCRPRAALRHLDHSAGALALGATAGAGPRRCCRRRRPRPRRRPIPRPARLGADGHVGRRGRPRSPRHRPGHRAKPHPAQAAQPRSWRCRGARGRTLPRP